MRDIGAVVGRPREAHLGIEIRTVDVHLTARPCTISQSARIRSSNTPCVDGYVTMMAAKVPAWRSQMPLEIVEIDIAVRITLHDDDLHPRHGRGGGVGAVRRGWNEAHRALRFIAAAVVCADGKQSGIFALRA